MVSTRGIADSERCRSKTVRKYRFLSGSNSVFRGVPGRRCLHDQGCSRVTSLKTGDARQARDNIGAIDCFEMLSILRRCFQRRIDMGMRISVIALYLAVFTTSAAYAHGGCVQDSVGQIICAPPAGSLQTDPIGRIVCGPGECVTDSMGQVKCSSQPGGGAMTNDRGKVVCVGGCVLAKASYCQIPRE
jgi:hypothetical protein